MTTLAPVTGSSDSSTVTVTVAGLNMTVPTLHLFTSSTNCWIKQGTAQVVTCATNANMVDGDTLSIAAPGKPSATYEYDKAADGVATGNQSWAAGAITAADVAATLATAIAAAQPFLSVTDNLDGTLTISNDDLLVTYTEQVAHASFTVTPVAVAATAADGSMYVPANTTVVVDGARGLQLGVLRDTLDGLASLTRAVRVD